MVRVGTNGFLTAYAIVPVVFQLQEGLFSIVDVIMVMNSSTLTTSDTISLIKGW